MCQTVPSGTSVTIRRLGSDLHAHNVVVLLAFAEDDELAGQQIGGRQDVIHIAYGGIVDRDAACGAFAAGGALGVVEAALGEDCHQTGGGGAEGVGRERAARSAAKGFGEFLGGELSPVGVFVEEHSRGVLGAGEGI